jgi:hypothetical protein
MSYLDIEVSNIDTPFFALTPAPAHELAPRRHSVVKFPAEPQQVERRFCPGRHAFVHSFDDGFVFHSSLSGECLDSHPWKNSSSGGFS